MEQFSTLLVICAGNSPVTGEFPAQRPVTRSFDVFFDLGLNKRLSKQSWGWWFETPSRPWWRHCNVHSCCNIKYADHGTKIYVITSQDTTQARYPRSEKNTSPSKLRRLMTPWLPNQYVWYHDIWWTYLYNSTMNLWFTIHNFNKLIIQNAQILIINISAHSHYWYKFHNNNYIVTDRVHLCCSDLWFQLTRKLPISHRGAMPRMNCQWNSLSVSNKVHCKAQATFKTHLCPLW